MLRHSLKRAEELYDFSRIVRGLTAAMQGGMRRIGRRGMPFLTSSLRRLLRACFRAWWHYELLDISQDTKGYTISAVSDTVAHYRFDPAKSSNTLYIRGYTTAAHTSHDIQGIGYSAPAEVAGQLSIFTSRYFEYLAA